MLVFANHRGRDDQTGRWVHQLRDWSGAAIPGNMMYPPIEMLYAASYLKKHGHSVDLVDGNAKHQSQEETVAEIVSKKPDYVATVSGWFSLNNDLEFFRAIKNAIPGCKTIMAGPNVTLEPDLALRSPHIDFVALGEFIDGINEILTGSLSRNVAYRDKGEIRVEPMVPIEPLDRIPFADWSLIDPSLYWVPFTRNNPFALAVTGVGCPHSKCTFCHQESYWGKAHRSHSAKYVIGEMDHLISLGFREVIYRDQCFAARREVVEALCRHLIDLGSPVTWRASTRVDRMDPELLGLMAEAGCYQLSFGFESFSDAALNWCNKGATVADGDRVARWTKEAGMELSGGFITGIPGEEVHSTREVLRLVRRRKIDFPQFFLLSLIYDREKRRFVPLHEDQAVLKRNQKKMRRLMLSFYLDPRYMVSQAHRILTRDGLSRIPDLFLDFLRYFW